MGIFLSANSYGENIPVPIPIDLGEYVDESFSSSTPSLSSSPASQASSPSQSAPSSSRPNEITSNRTDDCQDCNINYTCGYLEDNTDNDYDCCEDNVPCEKPLGALCCDELIDLEIGYTCEILETGYYWNCSGCECSAWDNGYNGYGNKVWDEGEEMEDSNGSTDWTFFNDANGNGICDYDCDDLNWDGVCDDMGSFISDECEPFIDLGYQWTTDFGG